MNGDEFERTKEMASRIDKNLAKTEGWHFKKEEKYGTLYVTVYRYYLKAPKWFEEIAAEIDSRLCAIAVERRNLFQYGLFDYKLAWSYLEILTFVKAINAALLMPPDSTDGDKTKEGKEMIFIMFPNRYRPSRICSQGVGLRTIWAEQSRKAKEEAES